MIFKFIERIANWYQKNRFRKKSDLWTDAIQVKMSIIAQIWKYSVKTTILLVYLRSFVSLCVSQTHLRLSVRFYGIHVEQPDQRLCGNKLKSMFGKMFVKDSPPRFSICLPVWTDLSRIGSGSAYFWSPPPPPTILRSWGHFSRC